MELTSPELAAAARDLADELATVWSFGSVAFAQGPPQPDLAKALLAEWGKDCRTCGVRREIMRRYTAAFAMGTYVASLVPSHPTSPGWATALDTHMYHAIEGPLIDRLKEIAGP